jgi:hypothetical protein
VSFPRRVDRAQVPQSEEPMGVWAELLIGVGGTTQIGKEPLSCLPCG